MIVTSKVMNVEVKHIADGEVHVFVMRSPQKITRLPGEALKPHYTCAVRVGKHSTDVAVSQELLSDVFHEIAGSVQLVIQIYYDEVRS